MLGYEGLDEVDAAHAPRVRAARPTSWPGTQRALRLELPPRESGHDLDVAVGCETAGRAGAPGGRLRRRARRAAGGDRARPPVAAAACTSQQRGVQRLARALGRRPADDDHRDRRTGPYPYAGVPWFSTPFGRDGIITALEMLWLAPDVARGVLRYLAATQATEVDARARRRAGQDPARDARRRDGGAGRGPVRPLLRQRRRDAAVRDAGGGLLPAHRRPARSSRRSGRNVDARAGLDRPLRRPRRRRLRRVRARRRRTGWCSRAGRTRTTRCSTPTARWPRGRSRCARCRATSTRRGRRRPSSPARSGEPTRGRGAARAQAERAARALRASVLVRGARHLRARARRRQAAVPRARRSNAGHCLFTGIADADARAPRGARRCSTDDVFSGWGIRTLADARGALQPDVLSQRLGLAARQRDHRGRAGALRPARHACVAAARRACSTPALFVDLHRLPELFCGFPRRPGEGPTLYPVACAPQAWAAGAVFMLLQAALGPVDRRPRAAS